jgi:hypothetical protein
MHISQVHPFDLAIVFPPKDRACMPKCVFRLRLRMAVQPTPKREVEQPIAWI